MENQICLMFLYLVIKWIQTIFLDILQLSPTITAKLPWNLFETLLRNGYVSPWLSHRVYQIRCCSKLVVSRGSLNSTIPYIITALQIFSAGKVCIGNSLRSVSISFKDEPSLLLTLLNHHCCNPCVLLYETGSWRKTGAKTDSLASGRVQSTLTGLRSLVEKTCPVLLWFRNLQEKSILVNDTAMNSAPGICCPRRKILPLPPLYFPFLALDYHRFH